MSKLAQVKLGLPPVSFQPVAFHIGNCLLNNLGDGLSMFEKPYQKLFQQGSCLSHTTPAVCHEEVYGAGMVTDNVPSGAACKGRLCVAVLSTWHAVWLAFQLACVLSSHRLLTCSHAFDKFDAAGAWH